MFFEMEFILSALGCVVFAMALVGAVDAVIVSRFRREIQNTDV